MMITRDVAVVLINMDQVGVYEMQEEDVIVPLDYNMNVMVISKTNISGAILNIKLLLILFLMRRFYKINTGKIMKRLAFYFFLLSLITISGCNQSKEAQTIPNPKTIVVNFSDAFDLFSSEEIIDLRFIQLETTEESMIGEISDIYISSDNIYILDKNNLKTVLSFSKDGEFLTKYGSIGRGPGEFSYVKSFIVDEESQQIELLVPPNHIMIYNIQGELIDEIKNYDQIPAVSFTKTHRGNYFLYGGHNDGFDVNRIYLVNRDGELLDKYFTEETNLFPFEEHKNNFTSFGSKTYFREFFDNTIYIVSEENISPVYEFDFGEYNLPPDPPGDLFLSIEKHASIVNFFENQDYFIASITQRRQLHEDPSLFFILKHLISGQVKLMRMPDSSRFVESFNFPLFLKETNEIVFSIHPVDLLLNSETLKNQPLLNQALNEIELIDESSNPILVFAKINSSFFDQP